MTKTIHGPRRSRACWILLFAASLAPGCQCNLQLPSYGPEQTVTIKVTGVQGEAQKEKILEELKGLTDTGAHTMTSYMTGGELTVQLAPVADPEAFSKKITFGSVTAVEDRTVKVKAE